MVCWVLACVECFDPCAQGLFPRELMLEKFNSLDSVCHDIFLTFFLVPPPCCWEMESVCVLTVWFIIISHRKSLDWKRHFHIISFLHVYPFVCCWYLLFLYTEMFQVLSEEYFPIFRSPYTQPDLHNYKSKLRALDDKDQGDSNKGSRYVRRNEQAVGWA